MQAEQRRRLADAALGALQGAGDEQLLELAARLFVEDALVEHFLNQLFQLIPHAGYFSSRPEISVNASTYLSRVRRTTSSGSEGTGGCLFHAISSR
jgi:hypothetical protein